MIFRRKRILTLKDLIKRSVFLKWFTAKIKFFLMFPDLKALAIIIIIRYIGVIEKCTTIDNKLGTTGS